MRLVLTASVIFTWLTIFGFSASGSIVGYDARMLIESQTFEAYAVGVLLNTGHICSVTMISRRLAITSRHCFLDQETGNIIPEMRGILVRGGGPNHGHIYPSVPVTKLGPVVAVGVFNMQATDYYEIRDLWWGPSGSTDDDWVVMRLDRSRKDPTGGYPGDHFATFQLARSSHMDSVRLVSHAGYSELFINLQKRGHTQHDCHILGRQGNILLHDCANSRGASGGPLWLTGTNEVLAINAFQTCPKEYADSDEACTLHGISNGAVGLEQFRSVVDVLISEGN